MNNESLPRSFLGLFLIVLFSAGFPGMVAAADSYAGEFNGEPMKAVLTTERGSVHGTLDVGGYVYRVTARRQGPAAEGEMRDQDGRAVPLRLRFDGDRLALEVYAQGAGSAPLHLSLARGAKRSGSKRAERDASRAQRDPALVGRWARSESYTSGDFSMVNQTRVTLFADGTFVMGPGRVIGGGDAGSFDSGSGGAAGEGGRWRTENRILYTAPAAGGGWSAYARYYVEGNKLLLTFGDGSRELWHRE